MIKSFIFDCQEAEHQLLVEVTFTARNEDYANIEDIDLFDYKTGEPIELMSIHLKDRSALENEADELAQEHAYEAYSERKQELADARAEAQMERMREEE